MTGFIPALRFRWLTRFYAPVVQALLKEEKFKKRLVEQANLKPGHQVLDLGCGTATLTIMLKRACPEATVIGLDGDSEVLGLARKKIAAADTDTTTIIRTDTSWGLASLSLEERGALRQHSTPVRYTL